MVYHPEGLRQCGYLRQGVCMCVCIHPPTSWVSLFDS